jgi:hypothetical protein
MEKFCWLSVLLTIVWIILINGIADQDDTTYMINNTLTTQCYKATVFSPYFHCKNRRILYHSYHHTSHTSHTNSGGTGTSQSGISNDLSLLILASYILLLFILCFIKQSNIHLM